MVVNAKNVRAHIMKNGTNAPAPGMKDRPRENASIVIWTPSSFCDGSHAPERTIVRPVMVHMTMVSMNVPVIDTNPCFAGSLVFAAAAAIGSEPSPASFENIPRAIPFCMAMKIVPTAPPVTAAGSNAALTIIMAASGSFSMFPIIASRHTAT